MRMGTDGAEHTTAATTQLPSLAYIRGLDALVWPCMDVQRELPIQNTSMKRMSAPAAPAIGRDFTLKGPIVSTLLTSMKPCPKLVHGALE